MTLLQDLVAAQIALLPVADRVAPDALGYGVDLSCVLDITPDAAEVDPQSTRALGEALVRRFISPRNSVLDDESYGLDLRARCNAAMAQQELTGLRSMVRRECLKDDRVDDAAVTLTFPRPGQGVMRVAIAITPHETTDTFSLTFFVTADGVQLQGSIDQHG
jgi:hypothetical protein